MYGSGSAILVVGVRFVPLGRSGLLPGTHSYVADERLANVVDRSKRLVAIQ